MFKKKEKPKKDHSGKSLSQYGLFDMPTNFDTGLEDVGDDENDDDLEAELAALAGNNGSSKPKKPKRKIIPQKELDSMISESLKDDDDNDDESVDENDPELLGELNQIADDSPEPEEQPPLSEETQSTGTFSEVASILSERLKNYEICESKAKEAGENIKAKRYTRAIKTLKDLIKQANLGQHIDLNDESIPPDIHPPRPAAKVPEVSKSSLPEPLSPSSETPKSSPTDEMPTTEMPVYDPATMNTLIEHQKQYKIAALKAKQSGDSTRAVLFLKVSKQFDVVIAALKTGQPVDLSDMPGSPEEFAALIEPKVQQNEVQQSQPETPAEEGAVSGDLIIASTVLEALEQRLAVYKEQETKVKAENNPSKARRYGRIIKQFEQAIKAHKAGKSVAYDELPTPPGYGPIPGIQPPVPERVVPPATPLKPSRPAPLPSTASSESGDSKSETSTSKKNEGIVPKSTQADKQMQILIVKQKQFKLAALEAKKRGEMTQAKEFLRQAKGFDKLIEASIAGLPVDWSSIPVSPDAKSQLDHEYNIVMSTENDEAAGIDNDLFSRLEIQLQKQMKMCLTTRDHNKAIGDIPGMNRFERLALNVTKDLDVIRISRKTGRVPKFHYETKEFAIVKCFTEIGDNDMEVTIHRGINIKTDKDIDTYVKMDFPFPQDAPYSDRTSTIKNTNNPEYGKTFVVPIQRNSRQCQRVFKRHNIKMEVYSKGCSCCDTAGCCQSCESVLGGLCCFGFFRSDALIATVNVKLQPLETHCEIHESFDLMEGRKKIGGKLEVQIRLRSPIQTQQVEQIQEKWLIIDQ